MRPSYIRAIVASFALGAVSAAHADVVISNFSGAVGTGTAFGGTATTQYKAFGFTMGGTSTRSTTSFSP